MLAAGGTIGMSPAGDGGAVPSLDADALVQAVPALAQVAGLRARTINTRPSVQLTAAEALDIARAAAGAADSGRGVVVTHGTDTLEEVALLCDLLYAGEPPIVFTGAMRHASALGADGPANLFDAVVVAGAAGAEGLGVLVSFAGAVHAARAVRKADSTAPDAFASPRLGPDRARAGGPRLDGPPRRALPARPRRRARRHGPHRPRRPRRRRHAGRRRARGRRRRPRRRRAGRRPHAAAVPGRAQARRRPRAGRRHRAARARVDPARHVRLRGRRARPAVRPADLRRRAHPGSRPDQADGLPGRGLRPRRDRRRVRAGRLLRSHDDHAVASSR